MKKFNKEEPFFKVLQKKISKKLWSYDKLWKNAFFIQMQYIY